MGKYKNYTGIDFFRLIAAILIITIHTSPLASFSVTGDFILTRIVARVAVPFFFMTSGFFLISRYSRDNDKLKKFVNKTACIKKDFLSFRKRRVTNGRKQMGALSCLWCKNP